MPEFKYRHKGTADQEWGESTIEAEDKEKAKELLDKIYGIERDEFDEPINNTVKIELI
jgi:hypothetical protein